MKHKNESVARSVQSIMDEYRQEVSRYGDLATTICKLGADLLTHRRLPYHTITSRVKCENSVRHKAERGAGKYKRLDNIQDVCGVRIITYFADDVDQVAATLSEEFAIDWSSSVDKRQPERPDQFGYASLHFVAGLSAERLKLPEYARFLGLQFEVQIRSVLQHAWAEIEHDLGYKPKSPLPEHLRRRFSILSGLLELADREFDSIRNDLERLTDEPSSTSIDQRFETPALREFILNEPLIAEADARLLRAGSTRIKWDEAFIGQLSSQLPIVGIHTIEELRHAVSTQRQLMVEVGSELTPRMRYDPISQGQCLQYLCYGLAAKAATVESVCNGLHQLGWNTSPDSTWVGRLLGAVSRAEKATD